MIPVASCKVLACKRDSPTVANYEENDNAAVVTSVKKSGVWKLTVCTDNNEHSEFNNKETPTDTGTDHSPHFEKAVVCEATNSSGYILIMEHADPLSGKSLSAAPCSELVLLSAGW